MSKERTRYFAVDNKYLDNLFPYRTVLFLFPIKMEMSAANERERN